ncbi:MAG: hypothetical protein IPP58_15070 [Holophagaceae bacterium]|uniref:Thiolase C-terminal domain-containing protein n=1 Tax=Candidatus Geothrix skivensis TaxID=2954439 RepID=A0A9D7XIY7_9BACT|nr:hypothetical protein [Candidatus Geothrix skivensis]
MRGGARAVIGHPIGASGTRILVTLPLCSRTTGQAARGSPPFCVGGGCGVAMLVERI